MTTGLRNVGDFCWINILTARPAEARAFFGALLGWTYAEMPGNIGHTAKVGGRDIGGIFDIDAPSTPKGTLPVIGVVVKVASADAAAEKARAVGGRAMPAFDVMDAGRLAVCTDPSGAQLDAWEPRKMLGTDADTSHHGAPSWFEAVTTDVDRAAKFYADLFGWAPHVAPMPGMQYTLFKHGALDIAGMMPVMQGMGERASGWTTYFTVKDVDETAREAVRLGGTLCVPPHDIPGIGRFCGITSPQGVTFHAITYLPRTG
jgi:uncharacterized protein